MRRADKLNHLHVPVVWKSGTLSLLEPLDSAQASTGIALPRFIRPSSVCRTQIHKKKCILGKDLRFTNIICDILVNSYYSK